MTIDDASQLDALLGELRALGDVSVERNRGIVALVGAGLGDSSATMARALAALGDIKVHMLSLSASGINLTLLVDGDQVTRAMQRLHAAFFPRRDAMSELRLAIVGDGKMGRAIAELARERGFDVDGDARRSRQRERHGDHARARWATPTSPSSSPSRDAAPANIARCVAAGYPVVVGTTGWYDAARRRVARTSNAADGALVHAPNFSLGVNLFLAIAAAAARRHAACARSSTRTSSRRTTPRRRTRRRAPRSRSSGRRRRALGRADSDHERAHRLTCRARTSWSSMAPFEQIRLTHTARDRRVFADGALRAARWLRRAARRVHDARRARRSERRRD